jgi:hypothetical protein
MKTIFVPLIGDVEDHLYHLGMKEKENFNRIENRISSILSAHNFLRYGHEFMLKVQNLIKKPDDTFFDRSVKSYAEGLGVSESHYKNFISLFEFAAHYGQVFPELKSLIPGCTSLFHKKEDQFIHNRLIDFPLMDIFNESPRLYYWKPKDRPAILNYSCEGLAPLFFQTIHDSGFSLALHHKPGNNFHRNGESIFKMTFNTLFESPNMNEFRKDLRKKISITKWGFYMMDQSGQVYCSDIDGASTNFAAYNLNETSPLIFTNLPLHHDSTGNEAFLNFCHSREKWLFDKIKRSKNMTMLDLLTDIKDQKVAHWTHPIATLSTVAAYEVNLQKGLIRVKEGSGALTASDGITEFQLNEMAQGQKIKENETPSSTEKAWKEASLAQSAYDEGEWDKAYHHLQMAESLVTIPTWKEIFKFYIHVWNFKFISNKKELAMIYREVKKLKLPVELHDQWNFLSMRLEKRLGLVLTIKVDSISEHLKADFNREVDAPKAIFNTWMKLIYPRLEILDVFSPHQR